MRQMNDPHVKALYYWVEHDESVDYDNAEPLDYEDELAEVHLEKRKLTLRPREHYASTQEAREAFEGFIRNWEFEAAVESGSRQFQLRYMDADIIDRNPTPSPGVVDASVTFRAGIPRISIKARVGKARYPSPPDKLGLDSSNPPSLAMVSRLDRYHQGRETLAAMSYFCFTVMTDSAKAATGTTYARKAVKDYYEIAEDLQREVSNLSTNRGGSEARKSDGLQQEFNVEERRFLLAAIQAFTRRVAEKATNPSASLKMLTPADMPPLPKETLPESRS